MEDLRGARRLRTGGRRRGNRRLGARRQPAREGRAGGGGRDGHPARVGGQLELQFVQQLELELVEQLELELVEEGQAEGQEEARVPLALASALRRRRTGVGPRPARRSRPHIEFLCPPEDKGVIAEPVPARAVQPAWFKKLPGLDRSALSATNNGLTVKRCVPFLDAMNL